MRWNIINSLFKTVSLKIYNPSESKKHIINVAMDRYARALQFLLDTAESKSEMLDTMRESQGSLRKQAAMIIDKDLLRSLNGFNVQPFKDSLRIEFINLIESYIKRWRKNERAQFPRITISDEELCEKIEKQGLNKRSLDRLCDKLESSKTVYFCRYSDHRDYALLYDPYKKRFYAKLYLLSQHDELKLMPQNSSNNVLQVVGKNQILPVSKRPERFIIVALSFGKEQEKLLIEAVDKPQMLKTARLLKKNNEYYLTINIAVEPEETYEIKNYAGFTTLNDDRMLYSICNIHGGLLLQGDIPWGDAALTNARDRIHILANSIVEVCYQYKAQAVFNTFPRYNALIGILDYKLPMKGLQKPVRVSPFGLWQTCPRCGYNSKKNSTMGEVFLCAACGYAIERIILPSYNLAKRIIKYQNDKVRFFCEQDQRGERLIKNSLLNIEYPIGLNQSLDDFFEFICERTDNIRELLINRDTEWTKEEKKLFSVWNKLLSADDIREIIEIEA